MGACGCGDFHGGTRFPGPDGSVYVLAFYQACDGCDAPAGFVVHRFDGDAIEEFEITQNPEADFGERAEFAIPVMSPQKMREAITSSGLGRAVLPGTGDDPMTLDDVFEYDPQDFDQALMGGLLASMTVEPKGEES